MDLDIRRADQIDPAWLTAALRNSGALPTGRVGEFSIEPVGNGLVADSFRFRLTHDGPATAPASIVGKFPSHDPVSRRSGSDHLLYVREVAFYREMAATLAIHTPRAHAALIDPATDDFVLLLDDLAPARQGDQLAGCSLADARVAMAEAAALHAPRWGDLLLPTLDWLAMRPAALGAMVDAMLPAIIALFRERFAGRLVPEHLAMVEKLPAALIAMRAGMDAPITVQHADFRLDNMMFDVGGGTRPLATLDWQTVTAGPGLTDVAYFLSAGISSAERRLHEGELVRFYHAELLRRGVRDYGWEACWRDYRRFTLHGILMGVFSALSVERTERADALFLRMTEGACEQAADHDSFGFWV
ncbi:phosphotransferase family protein [Sandarakinorhabdus sp. DWP1-3-1]|uniref:phosphotransferase family protein n=1 Tax=Sandarakinorhabdus sp. DWP1-3-1 TaxID=2804627 RepID=UPI003CF6CB57